MISSLKGLIQITTEASSVLSDDYNKYGPQTAIDNDPNTFWNSKMQTNQWWQIGFNVSLTIYNYTITTGTSFIYRPRGWIAKALINNNKWENVDERSGVETGGNTKYFSISSMYFLFLS